VFKTFFRQDMLKKLYIYLLWHSARCESQPIQFLRCHMTLQE